MTLSSSLYLCGPTSVGKSTFAIELAKQLDGEIVGADAFQVYQGLPLLSATPSKEQLREVRHHLIDFLPITETCNAGRYRTMALPVIEKIVEQKKVPVITGGTGFYIHSLISPLDPLPPSDPTLRASFNAYSLEQLIEQLNKHDPEAINLIDAKNRRRVERALEIVIQTNRPLAASRQQQKISTAKGLLLIRNRDELYERIEQNVHSMFEQGVIDEVAKLDDMPISTTAEMMIGLKEIQSLRRGEISQERAIAIMIQKTKNYAKRQLTWFKNQHNFPILNLSDFPSISHAVEKAIIRL